MAFRITVLILYIQVVFSTTILAQLSPVNPSQIKGGEIKFEYERIEGENATRFGTIYERISRDPEEGTMLISYVQELPNVTMTDSIILNAETFSPVKYHSLVPQMQDILVTYEIPGTTNIDMKRSVPGQETDTVMVVNTNQLVYDYH